MKPSKRPEITESAINIIAEGTHIEGKIKIDQIARVHGTLIGEVHAQPGSTLILSETALVEGTIRADTLFIDGFVRGDILATTKVVISGTGRVVGDIRTPSLTVDFGAYFEGRCAMEDQAPAATSNLSPTPA
jgi:cytoskeletal protein CcmA (bactofilin family)